MGEKERRAVEEDADAAARAEELQPAEELERSIRRSPPRPVSGSSKRARRRRRLSPRFSITRKKSRARARRRGSRRPRARSVTAPGQANPRRCLQAVAHGVDEVDRPLLGGAQAARHSCRQARVRSSSQPLLVASAASSKRSTTTRLRLCTSSNRPSETTWPTGLVGAAQSRARTRSCVNEAQPARAGQHGHVDPEPDGRRCAPAARPDPLAGRRAGTRTTSSVCPTPSKRPAEEREVELPSLAARSRARVRPRSGEALAAAARRLPARGRASRHLAWARNAKTSALARAHAKLRRPSPQPTSTATRRPFSSISSRMASSSMPLGIDRSRHGPTLWISGSQGWSSCSICGSRAG